MKFSRLARLLALDERLLRRLVRSRRVKLTFVFRVLCRMVDPDMAVMAVSLSAFSSWLEPFASRMALALLVCSLVVVVVKRTVRRRRPAAQLQASVPNDRFSFPSGHSAAAFAMAIAAFGVVPWAVPPLLLLACTIAYARMYLGVHYPIDVAAGAAIGLVTGSIVALVDIPHARWTLPL